MTKNPINLEFLNQEFTIATIALNDLSKWITTIEKTNLPFFFSKTNQEISLLIPSFLATEKLLRKEEGWLCFFIKGEISFEATAVLAPILTLLGQEKISILAQSTFSTDFVFFKKEKLNSVIDCLDEKYNLDISKLK